MLGHRGCRLGISHPEITEMQSRAIFEAACDAAAAIVRSMVEQPIPESLQIKNKCRQVWQGSGIKANRLAADQQAAGEDCSQLSQEELRLIFLSVNDAHNQSHFGENINWYL